MSDIRETNTSHRASALEERHPIQPGETEAQYSHRLIAELNRVQKTLEEDHIKTQALLNSLGEGLIATDSHGVITMVNSYAANALGYSENELIGKWFPKTIIAVDQYSQPLQPMSRPIIKALNTGKTVHGYSHYITSSGSVMPVYVTISPIVIGNLPTGAIEVFRDLTKEQQLDIAKDEFVSLASHQLRTPATAVKSILSMVMNGDFGAVTPIQRKYLEKAAHSNNRQLQVIEDLLNVALVDAGKMELDLEYTDLTSIIRDVVADHLESIKTRDQKMILKLPSQLNLLMDTQKIRMVIDNLISNASKYSPPSSHIYASLRRQNADIILKVSDEGVGISAEDVDRIFTKFTRLPNELSATVGGTGLGLFLTKSIVELHNGTILVESDEGSGTTFTVTLPTKWSMK